MADNYTTGRMVNITRVVIPNPFYGFSPDEVATVSGRSIETNMALSSADPWVMAAVTARVGGMASDKEVSALISRLGED